MISMIEFARRLELELAVLEKCHADNCASVVQLAHELEESRKAERLVRMQLAAERAKKRRKTT